MRFNDDNWLNVRRRRERSCRKAVLGVFDQNVRIRTIFEVEMRLIVKG